MYSGIVQNIGYVVTPHGDPASDRTYISQNDVQSADVGYLIHCLSLVLLGRYAQLLASQGEQEEAKVHFERALAADPDHPGTPTADRLVRVVRRLMFQVGRTALVEPESSRDA